jgi:transcriptional antiterminator RfaH
MTPDWYVVQSKPNKEMILWRELTVGGFDCLYPQLYVYPVNPRSHEVRPCFPRYCLFLHTDLQATCGSMFQWMPFSNGFGSFGGTPASVPDNLMRAIHRHGDDINAASVEHVTGLKRGEVVIIDGGPFGGYEAVFDTHLTGSERIRVLWKLLQAWQVSLELLENYVRRKGIDAGVSSAPRFPCLRALA